MELQFQIELTTNVILTKKILDIKLKKAKKEKLVKESQAIEQVQGRALKHAPSYSSEQEIKHKQYITNTFNNIHRTIFLFSVHKSLGHINLKFNFFNQI